MDDKTTHKYERTPDEIAWDEEFKDESSRGLASDLGDMVKFAARLPGAILSNIVPDETARHARAAAREGFLAIRSLLGAIGDGIEDILAEPSKPSSTATVQGPPGTWGTGRTNQPTPISGKSRRIDISDDTSDTTSE
jgi:hypothetical protein